MRNRKIESNVIDFLSAACALYGEIEAERFSQEMFCNMLENTQSPIEDMFWVALHMQCLSEYIPVNPEFEFDRENGFIPGYGVHIQPQKKVGNYRVDFVLTRECGPNKLFTPVAVELDGHDYHDKNKTQRAYEKGRDRFLVKSGYRVIHFTGSEVVADPYKVAYETLDFLEVFAGSRNEYDPTNPLGIA